MRIVFLPETLDYFNELVTILFEKEYFGFEESALKYVDDLIDQVKNSLHTKIKKPAPHYFIKYGKGLQYVTFSKSRTTQWFVFFTTYQLRNETIYLIRYISNNHTVSQLL